MNKLISFGSICLAVILVVAGFSSVTSAKASESIINKRISVIQQIRNKIRGDEWEWFPGYYIVVFVLFMMGMSLEILVRLGFEIGDNFITHLFFSILDVFGGIFSLWMIILILLGIVEIEIPYH